MPPTLRTARVASGITASFKSMDTLLTAIGALAARSKNYENAILENTGDTDLSVAVMDDQTQVPVTADEKTLAPGQELRFRKMDTRYTYVLTADINGTNVIEMSGDPVFGI